MIPVIFPSASVPHQHQLSFASFRLLLPSDEPSHWDNHHPVSLYSLLGRWSAPPLIPIIGQPKLQASVPRP